MEMSEAEFRRHVASEVRAAMWRKDITAAQLAHLLGIAKSTLQERLNGNVSFTLEQAVALQSILEVRLENLLPAA